MKYRGYFYLSILFIVSLVLIAGCTSPAVSPATPAPAATAATTQSPQQPAYTQQQPLAPTASASGSGIDTTLNVHYNDFACFDLQKGLGVDYLYEDQKFKVGVGLPLNGRASLNALVLDTEDKTKMVAVPPKFNDVSKVWVYEGLVPLLQFNDITTPQQKTITIKRQGQFYLCVDDRKETGGSDVTLQVPITFTPA